MARDNWDGADPKFIGKVYVGGIGADVTRGELESEYSKYGSIRDVWIAHNPAGFAFVEFYEERDAIDAIRSTDGKRVCGYKVSVEASHGRKSKRKRYLEDVRCYNCNRWGHLAKVCTRAYGDYRRSPPRRRSRSRSPRRRYRSRSRSRSRTPCRRTRSRSPRRSTSRNRSRDRSRDRSRSKRHTRSRSKSRDRSPRRSRSRSRDNRSKSRENSREKSREKSRDKSRERSRDRSRGRSRDRSRDKSAERSEERKMSASPVRDDDNQDFVQQEED